MLLVVGLALPVEAVIGAGPTPPAGGSDPTTPPAVPPNDRLGIAHISYGSQVASDARYQLARNAGAGWNRWVAYWGEIERAPGIFDYSKHDAAVTADRRHGLQLAVVLMGTPGFYATTTAAQTEAAGKQITPAASAPRDLDRPVFADGSDELAPGKAVNPENYWARFVNTTVARYRGYVRYWELWNEPDFSTFWWTGDGQEVKHYARLLKVGYLAAKAANPEAQVLVGGLMYWEWRHRSGVDHAWLRAFLQELGADPDRQRHGYYFDVLPLHWYARPADLYDKTLDVRRLLVEHGLTDKAIWVNETNLAVCGDPQMAGKPDCTPRVPKGRTVEQASFILQAIANAFAAGVDKLFAFQLYDDAVGPLDYYGLVRNDHTARPAYVAYQVAARYFRGIDDATKVAMPPLELVRMVRQDGTVVTVAWNSGPQPITVGIPALAQGAVLVTQDGATQNVVPSDGLYPLTLPGATLNLTDDAAGPDYLVGGETYLIVEAPPRLASPATPSPTATRPTATPTPIAAVSTPMATPEVGPSIAHPLATPALESGAVTAPAWPLTATTPLPTPDPPAAISSPDKQAEQLHVPAGLSTVRISDIRADAFTVSWASSAPAKGIVRCGTKLPLADLYEEDLGDGRRSVTHLVAVTNRRPNTSYLCVVEAGVEIDDNGGAYFQVTTPAEHGDASTVGVEGVVVDERGRPKDGVLVYGVLEGGCTEGGAASATKTDGAGRYALAVASSNIRDDGACPDNGLANGDRRVRVTAIGATVLAAERLVDAGETLAEPLRLRFTWSLYENASIALQAGWNELTLPLLPLWPQRVGDLAREVASQGGRLTEVYWHEDGRWHGGEAFGSAPLVPERRYLLKAERRSTWSMRGLAYAPILSRPLSSGRLQK